MSEHIDRSWLNYQHGIDYLRGIEDFLRQASNYLDKKHRTKCPCKKCKNIEYRHINIVKQHLFDYGMQKDYTRWVYHGEPEVLSDDDDDDDDVDNNGSQQGLGDFLADLRSARETMEIQIQQCESRDTHEWEALYAHIESEDFKNSSERNKRNRKDLMVNHRDGCKSFVRHGFGQRDPETGEEPDRVEFYRNMRWNSKQGSIADEAEQNYEKMVEIRSQPVEEGAKRLTDGEIVEKVLGKRPDCVIGLGRAVVPPSRKAKVIYNDEVNQLRMRIEKQDRELNELRAWKASQEELINAQQQKIDAQAKKQEETVQILNALKQKLGL